MSNIESRSCTIENVSVNIDEFGEIVFDFKYAETYYASNGEETFDREISYLSVYKNDAPELTAEQKEQLRLALNKKIENFAEIYWEEAEITDESIIVDTLVELNLFAYPDDEDEDDDYE